MSVPSKAKIFEYWMKWLSEKGMDWGEPCCWACGKFWWDKYDIKKPHATRQELMALWEHVPLQRCHIIAKQFGGSDDVSNLFLMCIDCHDKAPNTRSTEAFFIWVEKQNWFENFSAEVMKELNTYGLQDRISEITELLHSGEIKSEMSKELGIHMNQKGRGAQITMSTYMAAIYNHLQEKDTLK